MAKSAPDIFISICDLPICSNMLILQSKRLRWYEYDSSEKWDEWKRRRLTRKGKGWWASEEGHEKMAGRGRGKATGSGVFIPIAKSFVLHTCQRCRFFFVQCIAIECAFSISFMIIILVSSKWYCLYRVYLYTRTAYSVERTKMCIHVTVLVGIQLNLSGLQASAMLCD